MKSISTKIESLYNHIRLIGDTIAVFAILFTAWCIELLTGNKNNWHD